MKKITYTQIGTVSAVEDSPKDCHLICLPGQEGHLEIGELKLPLQDGTASIHPASLPDGRYTPVLSYAGQRTALQPLEKLGRALYPAAVGIEEYLRFVTSVTALEEKLGSLEEKVNRLSLLVEGTTIFNI